MMPTYRCWNPEHGDESDGRDVDAYDAEYAVKRFAQWYDAKSSEYPYADVGGVVCVRLSTGAVASFNVTGEPSITYHATPAKGSES